MWMSGETYRGDGRSTEITNSSGSAYTPGQCVLFGTSKLPMVVMQDIPNNARGIAYFSGKFFMNVTATNAEGNSAVAVGDKLYVDANGVLSKDYSGDFFGFALGAVSAGATTMIEFILGGPDLRTAKFDQLARTISVAGQMSFGKDADSDAQAPTSEAWEFTFDVWIEDSAGNVMEWVNGAYASTLTIADTSTAGTATVKDGNTDHATTLTFTDGRAKVTIMGDAAAWLDTETATATIGNLTINGETVTGGDCIMTITA
jgi:hypothetical protein